METVSEAAAGVESTVSEVETPQTENSQEKKIEQDKNETLENETKIVNAESSVSEEQTVQTYVLIINIFRLQQH